MSKITYANKDKTSLNDVIRKFRDVDANEIKAVVNALDDLIIALTTQVTANNAKISYTDAAAVAQLVSDVATIQTLLLSDDVNLDTIQEIVDALKAAQEALDLNFSQADVFRYGGVGGAATEAAITALARSLLAGAAPSEMRVVIDTYSTAQIDSALSFKASEAVMNAADSNLQSQINAISALLASDDLSLDTIQEIVDALKAAMATLASMDEDSELIALFDAFIGNTIWRSAEQIFTTALKNKLDDLENTRVITALSSVANACAIDFGSKGIFKKFSLTLGENTTVSFSNAAGRDGYKIYLEVTGATRTLTMPASVLAVTSAVAAITGASWNGDDLILPVGKYELGFDFDGTNDYMKVSGLYE